MITLQSIKQTISQTILIQALHISLHHSWFGSGMRETNKIDWEPAAMRSEWNEKKKFLLRKFQRWRHVMQQNLHLIRSWIAEKKIKETEKGILEYSNRIVKGFAAIEERASAVWKRKCFTVTEKSIFCVFVLMRSATMCRMGFCGFEELLSVRLKIQGWCGEDSDV